MSGTGCVKSERRESGLPRAHLTTSAIPCVDVPDGLSSQPATTCASSHTVETIMAACLRPDDLSVGERCARRKHSGMWSASKQICHRNWRSCVQGAASSRLLPLQKDSTGGPLLHATKMCPSGHCSVLCDSPRTMLANLRLVTMQCERAVLHAPHSGVPKQLVDEWWAQAAKELDGHRVPGVQLCVLADANSLVSSSADQHAPEC